jgi:hypothetical protein
MEDDEMMRPMTAAEQRVEKLAMSLVNDLGLLPANEAAGRFSAGHGWHRTTEAEQEEFRAQARKMLAGNARAARKPKRKSENES